MNQVILSHSGNWVFGWRRGRKVSEFRTCVYFIFSLWMSLIQKAKGRKSFCEKVAHSYGGEWMSLVFKDKSVCVCFDFFQCWGLNIEPCAC